MSEHLLLFIGRHQAQSLVTSLSNTHAFLVGGCLFRARTLLFENLISRVKVRVVLN